jgi:hypothetical protein
MIEEWPITAVHVANIKVLVAEFNGVCNSVWCFCANSVPFQLGDLLFKLMGCLMLTWFVIILLLFSICEGCA